VLALMLVVLAILHFWRRHRKKQRSRPKTAGSSDATGAVKGAYARTLDCQLGNANHPYSLSFHRFNSRPVRFRKDLCVCFVWGSPFGTLLVGNPGSEEKSHVWMPDPQPADPTGTPPPMAALAGRQSPLNPTSERRAREQLHAYRSQRRRQAPPSAGTRSHALTHNTRTHART
jgi:hypothetical protein